MTYQQILAQLALDGKKGRAPQLLAESALKRQERAEAEPLPALAHGGVVDGPEAAASAPDAGVVSLSPDQAPAYTGPDAAPPALQGVELGPNTVFDPVTGAPSNPVAPNLQPSDEAQAVADAQAGVPNARGATVDGGVPQPIPTTATMAPAPAAVAMPAEPQPAPTPPQAMPGGSSGGRSAVDKLLLQQNAGATAASQEQAKLDQDIGTAAGATNADMQTRLQALDSIQARLQTRSETALQSALSEAQKTGKDIDPNRWWNSRSSGQKALAGISMFLGGIGGINPIKDQITRDVEAQKQSAENHGKAGQMFESIAKSYLEAGQNQRQAFDSAQKTLTLIQANKAVELAGQHAGPLAAAKLQEALAQNGFTAQHLKADLAKSAAETAQMHVATASAKLDLAQKGSLYAAQSNLQKGVGLDKLPADQQNAYMRNAYTENRVLPGVGITNMKLSPEEQNQFSKANSVKNILGQLSQLAQKGSRFDTKDRDQAAALSTLLKEQMTEAVGSKGTLSMRNEPILSEILDNPLALTPNPMQMAKFEGQKAAIHAALDTATKSLGGGLAYDMNPGLQTVRPGIAGKHARR